MSISLHSTVLEYSFLLSYTCLRFSLYLYICISNFRSFHVRIKMVSLGLIWYQQHWNRNLDDQDMSISLQSVVLDCSCLLSYTCLRFPLFFYICILKFRSFNIRINMASLALICYKKYWNPNPCGQDMSISLHIAALYSCCLLSGTCLRFSSYLQIWISKFRS